MKVSPLSVGIVVLRSISLVKNTALGLDAERAGHVEQEDVLDVALDYARLDHGAHGDDLVRVHALVRVLHADQLLDLVDDGGHAGHAADEDDVVDRLRVEAGVGQALLGRGRPCARAGRR